MNTQFTLGSLFAGIGGFDEGFRRAGFETIWAVEIDKQAQGIFRRHFPDVEMLDDVKDVGAHNLVPVDVIAFGSPCQDLSVAGKRAGMEGERSGLFYEAIRICQELRPTFTIWENVFGALSSHSGRDFAAALDAFRQLGARDIAWRVLDAQYSGVPQRRRRIFLVADLAGERAAEVLLEPESVCWHPAASGEAGTGAARGTTRGAREGSERELDQKAYTIHAAFSTAMTGGGDAAAAFETERARTLDSSGGFATNQGGNVVVSTLQGGGKRGQRLDAEMAAGGQQLPTSSTSDTFHSTGQSFYNQSPIAGTDSARDWKDGQTTLVTSLTGERMSALSSEGADASEDGTGRGTPLVLSLSQNQRGEVRTSEIAAQLSSGGGKPGQGYPTIAFSCKDDGRDAALELTPTLRAMEYDKSHLNGGGQVAVTNRLFGVRRLTPTECERLMAFPDSWTTTNADGRPVSDSARYRLLGNSVVVNVVEWIAHRIAAALADSIPEEEAS